MKTITRNADYTKEYNRKLIINLLFRESMSRAELARKTGLTRAAVSIIADEMISDGLVMEKSPTVIKRGRSPIPLALNQDFFYAAGVCLSRDACLIGISNLAGNCLSAAGLDLKGITHTETAIDLICNCILNLIKSSTINADKVLGIGISTPGPVSAGLGQILNPPNFDLWHNTYICDAITKKTAIRAYVENNSYALANFNVDNKQLDQGEDFLLVVVDSGIGAGIISNNRLYRGINGLAGEIGHSSINYLGEQCSCGNTGCLELYASIPNILKKYKQKYLKWQQVIDDASKDSTAKEILEQEADYLSIGIVNLINVLDIHTVILAGEIAYGFDILAPILEKKINKIVINRSKKIKIVPPKFTDNVDIKAACNIVFSHFLSIY